RPLLGGRTGHPRRSLAGARAPVRAPGSLDRGRPGVLGARARAPRGGRADARRLSGRRGARGPTPGNQRAAPEATVTLPALLLVSAAYLVPRVVGRRWAEPIVAHAAPRLEKLGRAFAPFVPWRDPSTRTTLAAVLTNADTEALASADEMAVVSGVLAFADRPVRELMTPRTSIVAIPEGLLAAEAAHVCLQSGYSRYPVYRGSLDEVIGVTHAFGLLRL